MEIPRQSEITPLSEKTFLLFGPRSTGKITLIRQQLAKTATVIDLLDSRYFLRLSTRSDNILVLPWQQVLTDLWEDKFI